MVEAAIPLVTVRTLADNYDTFLLDCDGVLWSGSKPIDQAFEVITWLSKLPNKKVFFLTNSSGRTRDDYVEKIRKFGFENCTKEMIYGSAYTTARYIKEKYPDIKKVRVVGMSSICKEMAEVGIESCGGEDDEGFSSSISLDDFEAYKLDPEVKAVVVGLDTSFTYAKLCLASLYIATGEARFIATNDDAYDMVNGRKMPGAGAMV